ncbi:hypothetical protein KCP76_05655 [Salmonella enterica subsp. enterica serovar Weltevreden]|nr:hypothetical protein KCP76_05655 [Salmonella enterica subsp. enterica serovar Weltevreden]
MTNPAYRRGAMLMLDEQAPTLSMPEGTDLEGYANLLIARFTNPRWNNTAPRRSRWMAVRNRRSVCWTRCACTLQQGDDHRRLGQQVAGRMRYVGGVDEQGKTIDVVDPLAQYQAIHQQYRRRRKNASAGYLPSSLSWQRPAEEPRICASCAGSTLPTAIAEWREKPR